MAHILTIEDDPVFRDFLVDAMGDWGHEVDVAGDGPEAYHRIYLGQPAYDLVVCDLLLPSMQGPDLLRRVARQVRNRTPVIVVSGKERAIDALGDVRDWVFRVLKKPLELEDLREAVDQALMLRETLLGTQALEERIAELEERVHDLVDQNVELFEEARLDPLTRLPNRRRLEEDLGKKYANVERYGAAFAVALCDIDGFRRYNHEFGYEGGDAAICYVARRLHELVREGDTVYRFGGDEFVVVMEAQGIDQAVQVADRLRAALALLPGPKGVADAVTMSVGVSAAQEGTPRSTMGMLREANRQLTAAKEAGGNRVFPAPVLVEDAT